MPLYSTYSEHGFASLNGLLNGVLVEEVPHNNLDALCDQGLACGGVYTAGNGARSVLSVSKNGVDDGRSCRGHALKLISVDKTTHLASQ